MIRFHKENTGAITLGPVTNEVCWDERSATDEAVLDPNRVLNRTFPSLAVLKKSRICILMEAIR